MKSVRTDSDDTLEQTRLIIAVAIVATGIAVASIPEGIKSAAPIINGLISYSSFMSFLFIVMTASKLKYKEAGRIGELTVPERLRRVTYDWSINGFWISLIPIVLLFTLALFGWKGDPGDVLGYWPSFIVSFVLLLIVTLVLDQIGYREKIALGFKPKQKYKQRRK